MKKLIVLLIACCFVGGCIGNGLSRQTFDDKGNCLSDLKVGNLGGMVNVDTNDFKITIEDSNNGDFKLTLKFNGRKQEDSPESATSLGQMIKTGSSNFTPAGTVGELIK